MPGCAGRSPAPDFFAVEFQAQALGGVAHRSLQHAVRALQRVLDHGGAGGAVHAVDTQALVVIAVADPGAGGLRQLAHPAHAEALRVVMQAQAGAAVFADEVNLLQAFGLQQFGQPPHAGVALIGDIRQDQGQVQRQFFSHCRTSKK